MYDMHIAFANVVEAMAMGVPVVATTLANQGIHGKDRKEIMIADDPKDFAQAVVELLKNKDLRSSMANHARRFVEEHYTWGHNLLALDEAIAAALHHREMPQKVSEVVALG